MYCERLSTQLTEAECQRIKTRSKKNSSDFVPYIMFIMGEY